MVRFLFSIIFLFTSYFSFSQSQREINSDASKKFEKADKELNRVYQEILKDYKKEAEFTKNLRGTQRLLLKLRDAEMKTKYPDKGSYGSNQLMCWLLYKATLTEAHTNKLKIWLVGIEEGDVCAG